MSGRKHVLKSFQSLTSGSMATSLTSAITDGQFQDNLGFQIKWASANAVGVIAIEASINYDPHLLTGDWIALTFSPTLQQPNSDNGNYLVNMSLFPYPYYRVTYTRTSGTGTLNIWVCAKEV